MFTLVIFSLSSNVYAKDIYLECTYNDDTKNSQIESKLTIYDNQSHTLKIKRINDKIYNGEDNVYKAPGNAESFLNWSDIKGKVWSKNECPSIIMIDRQVFVAFFPTIRAIAGFSKKDIDNYKSHGYSYYNKHYVNLTKEVNHHDDGSKSVKEKAKTKTSSSSSDSSGNDTAYTTYTVNSNGQKIDSSGNVVGVDTSVSNAYKNGFDMCQQKPVLKVFQLIGILVGIIKILVPVLIIILGMVDLAKAVMAGDDKASKTATLTLGKRFAAGIIIFFIPMLVDVILNFIANYSTTIDKFRDCNTCFFNPSNGDCDDLINSGEE
jgi:hypothetical protein